jgi:aspartate/tyrosine/aromatic aminotransferase
MEQDEQRIVEVSIETQNLIKSVPVKKTRKRLPSEERLRNELVYQLRESLRSIVEKMNSQELSLTERQRWTQVHTYTAQVYNTILKDQQLREWERRLKELEKNGLAR